MPTFNFSMEYEIYAESETEAREQLQEIVNGTNLSANRWNVDVTCPAPRWESGLDVRVSVDNRTFIATIIERTGFEDGQHTYSVRDESGEIDLEYGVTEDDILEPV